MSIQQHILPLVVLTVMLGIGLELRVEQFRMLLRRPRTPILGTLVHTIAFPSIVVGALLAARFAGLGPGESTMMGMLLIAACPSGGFSNVLASMAGVNLALSVVLTAISTLASFATVPLLMGAFSALVSELGQPIAFPIRETLVQLIGLIIAPIGLGIAVRARNPALADRLADRLQRIGQAALYVCVVVIAYQTRDVILEGAREALPWSLFLCAANLAGCVVLSRRLGLEPADAVTVAFEGVVRNLAVALLVAISILRRPDVAALPTIYFVAVLIVAIAFARTWRRLPGLG